MTGFGGKKWSLFTLVSPFGVKKWSFDEKVGTAPTNLRFQRFYTQIQCHFPWVQWPLFKGEIFHENFKIISKKIQFSRGKKFRKIKIPRVFLKKNLKILVEFWRPCRFFKNKLSARDESENLRNLYIMNNIYYIIII